MRTRAAQPALLYSACEVVRHAARVAMSSSSASSSVCASSDGVLLTWPKMLCARCGKSGGLTDNRPAEVTAPFSLMSHRPARPCRACAHSRTTRNRQPATQTESARCADSRTPLRRKSASHNRSTSASASAGGMRSPAHQAGCPVWALKVNRPCCACLQAVRTRSISRKIQSTGLSSMRSHAPPSTQGPQSPG